MDNPRKFLIIRFSSIGDIVLCTPIIRCIKKQIPNAEIHFAIKKNFVAVLQGNPYIHKLHIITDNVSEIIPQLKTENFEAIIDLHNNLRSAQIKKAIKPAKKYTINKLNIKKWLFTAFKINTLPAIHIVDRKFEAVKPLGIYNDGAGLDYFVPDIERIKQNDIPTSHSAGFIAIVIGAAHFTKRIPKQKLLELVQAINFPIILMGGKEDYLLGKEIAAADDVRIYNSCGKFSLNESADIVRQCKYLITSDTGLMHIAAAFKKPIKVVWGNTHPAFGMYPYQTQHINFEQKLGCRPCSKIGYNSCPRKHFKCMNNHNMQQIATANF
jgi:ADP-heptose:LPS heptosyltransferase